MAFRQYRTLLDDKAEAEAMIRRHLVWLKC